MAAKRHEEAKEKSTLDGADAPPPKIPDQPPKPKVCRRLQFGTDLEDEVKDLLSLSNEDMEQLRRKGMEKWNFDFVNEIPLEGNWQWERVPSDPPQTREVISDMEKHHQENRTV